MVGVRYTVGIDSSLTGTGLARVFGDGSYDYARLERDDLRGPARLAALLDAVVRYASSATFVVLEGPAYGSQASGQSGHHERAGLWHLISVALWQAGTRGAVVPPNIRALYATGDSRADKTFVHGAMVRRFDGFDPSASLDEADALALAALAADHLGFPPVKLPAANRAALEKVPWDGGLMLPPPKPRKVAAKPRAKKAAPRLVLGPNEAEVPLPLMESVG